MKFGERSLGSFCIVCISGMPWREYLHACACVLVCGMYRYRAYLLPLVLFTFPPPPFPTSRVPPVPLPPVHLPSHISSQEKTTTTVATQSYTTHATLEYKYRNT